MFPELDSHNTLCLGVHHQSTFFPEVPTHHTDTSFLSDPTTNENVIFLPGGKVMIVDLGIQSFVKNLVAVVIAGGVLVGVGVYGILWADQRLKKNRKVVLNQPGAPPAPVPVDSDIDFDNMDNVDEYTEDEEEN